MFSKEQWGAIGGLGFPQEEDGDLEMSFKKRPPKTYSIIRVEYSSSFSSDLVDDAVD